MDIVIATGNKGKLLEFKALLKGHFENIFSVTDLGLSADVEETGKTFRENALLKAEFVKSQTPLAVLADDSGLCVDALNGEPGVYSARYSGAHSQDNSNREKLFSKLAGVKNRKAQFVSVVILIFPDGKMAEGEGCAKGKILEEEIGDNGFGYDCMFFSDELQMCFARASADEKNAVSHRAKAVKDLLSKLNQKSD